MSFLDGLLRTSFAADGTPIQRSIARFTSGNVTVTDNATDDAVDIAITSGSIPPIPVNTADSITKGTHLTLNASTGRYIKASAANLGTSRISQYMSKTDAVVDSGDATLSYVEVYSPGDVVPNSVTGLGAGSAQRCRIHPTTGKTQRRSAMAPTDYECGKAETDGSLTYSPDMVNPDTTGILWISPLDGYGAKADGTDDGSDDDALDSLMQAISDQGTYRGSKVGIDLSPRGSATTWTFQREHLIYEDTANHLAGLFIRGATGGPSQDYLASASLLFTKAKKAFTGKTCTASAVDQNVSLTDNEASRRPTESFVTLTGSDVTALGLVAGDVGKEVLVANSSYAALNGYAVIVALPASNQVTISSTGPFGSVPGSITLDLRLLDSLFRIGARNVKLMNLYVTGYGANVHAHSVATITESPNAGATVNTRCHIENVTCDGAVGGTIDHVVNVGAQILPVSGNSNYISSGHGSPVYGIPYMTPNCDFVTLKGVTSTYQSSAQPFHTHNTTHQNRCHRLIEVASANGTGITSVRYLNSSNTNTVSSTSITAYDCVADAFDGYMFEFGKAQAPSTIVAPKSELPAQLLGFNQTAVASKHSITIVGAYLQLGVSGGPGDLTSPFIECDNCDLTLVGVKFSMNGTGAPTPFYLVRMSGYRPTVTMIGCELPAESDMNGGKHFLYGNVVSNEDISVSLVGCTEYDLVAGASYKLVDEIIPKSNSTINKGFSARRGNSGLRGCLGISATNLPANNLIGEVTISDTDTRGVLAFTTDEEDALATYNTPNDKLDILVVCTSKTSGAAANSAIVASTLAAIGHAEFTIHTAPGAGQSATYSLFMIRHANRPAAAWHPAKKSTLAVWCVSDKGYGVTNRNGDYWFWRNRAGFRGAESALGQSQCDPAIDPVATPTQVPSVSSADADFNDRDVLSFDGNDFLAFGSNDSVFPCLNTNCTIFVVAKAGSDKTNYQEIFGTVSGAIQLRCDQTSGDITMQSAGGAVTYASDWSGGVKVVAAKFNGASSKLFVNARTAVATGTTNATGSGDSAVMVIGDYTSAGGFPWKGKLGEILIFREALSDAEIGYELDRLGAKWNITIGA